MCDYNDFSEGGCDYIIENGKFKCISYGLCGKQWRDEKYYQTDDE